jgi:protease-4
MKSVMKKYLICLILVLASFSAGCAPKIKLLPDATEPLREFVISGSAKEKVLVIPIRGVISDNPRGSIFKQPSMVQAVVSQLRLAEKDQLIKAIILKVNTPGGSATASDIIYHEIMNYKKKSGAKVVAAMMDLATSGGYYVSLPADLIVAHPTTITGSVGVIFLMPKIDGLMSKIGVAVDIQKSGRNKDMASPFRQATEEERRLLQDLTDTLGNRFAKLVKTHRKINPKKLDQIITARVYIAKDAKAVGLVDEVGYLSDALSRAKKIAGLSEDARVIVYRRTEYANDNIYNTATAQSGNLDISLINLNLPKALSSLDTGFYYLWLPASGSN